MKVTVCELPNRTSALEEAWSELAAHVRTRRSDLVVLPEMPFHPWLPHHREVSGDAWRDSVRSHEKWLQRLDELAPAYVIATRPVETGGIRLNAGFIKAAGESDRIVHTKYYLPDEPGFWEATWYQRGDGDFSEVDTPAGRIGMLICTELWFTHHARDYAGAGIQILASPRATPAGSAGKWLAGGRAAAVVSGAFCLSSNLSGSTEQGGHYAGMGWIIEPEEGEVLALTSTDQPFATVDIDLSVADRAKQTYPRYVPD